jgi:nitrogen fixation-related uncharacterized protein
MFLEVAVDNMEIYYIILGIVFVITLTLWWVFESGVFVDTMEEYLKDKDKPFDKDRKKF